MLENFLAPKFMVLYVFVASAMYVHYRGRVRHGFLRQLTDHSSLMAAYNALMYLFSAVPNRPFIHRAENKTDVTRVILFCDIERPLSSRIMTRLNRGFRNTAIRASQTENAPGDRIGVLNRDLQRRVSRASRRQARQERSKLAHYTLKWLIIGGLLYWIFA